MEMGLKATKVREREAVPYSCKAPIEEGHCEVWVNGQEQQRNGLGHLYTAMGTSDP